MTTKPNHPVVEVLEEAKHTLLHIKEVCDTCPGYPEFVVIPKTIEQVEQALPLVKELVEKASAYDAAHSELERSNNELGACRRVANDLRKTLDVIADVESAENLAGRSIQLIYKSPEERDVAMQFIIKRLLEE